MFLIVRFVYLRQIVIDWRDAGFRDKKKKKKKKNWNLVHGQTLANFLVRATWRQSLTITRYCCGIAVDSVPIPPFHKHFFFFPHLHIDLSSICLFQVHISLSQLNNKHQTLHSYKYTSRTPKCRGESK